jgi:hypothetical protein
MGLFKKSKDKAQSLTRGRQPLVIDPKDLKLPKEIPTDAPGVVFTHAPGSQKEDIDIVGESFRAENVAAVATAADGQWFDIYLVAEPTNQYDKNAIES